MASGNGNGKKNLVVIQLTGGNDTLNTVIPYNDGLYYDNRRTVAYKPESVLPISDELAFNPKMGSMKRLWDDGKMALINGIGYPSPNRSHFRSMDIWHTAEPDDIGKEGWLGRTARVLDPNAENVLTAVNFGRGLPRALGVKGVPVASVGNLETYGLFPDLQDDMMRKIALDAFAKMYGGARGQDAVMDFLGQTGSDALKGADILRTAPGLYSSNVEYAANPIADSLKSVAQVMFANLGTRIYYTIQGGYDTHSGEMATHAQLWDHLSGAVGDFWDDLVEHDRQDDTLIFIFSEFGRRIKDNGSGTDHGSGGSAFLVGGQVIGGMYGEYPSLEPEKQLEGDLQFNNDFRRTYATILDRWLHVGSEDIINGSFEPHEIIAR
ncbi:MAG: DUF1501 domain-containing protein [SAR202 cluster bacterium]|jgi:uncharacterized protein (DUF1501 family)|nr:DUF1501 domain-containing protein [SAR202 cluster bacterium]MQG82782.1 DUF1501 domain-containing protein [SAR202 cluster bacterium]HIM91470.1 DUF1501 domain-containing protein [Dehalococcoidia bacterium]HIN72866.1 DUF1501 domain-containing protein [Dehalococcoidia bacterium]|tara:strand:+ start:4484 stop:5623 length:1140 start_codon:yes stop_codon:yes gene_type:complete